MKKTAAADIVIFGGGIAGLWLLHRLRKSGYSALLFESGALGGGQTNKAQGIIHGGMKYALQGVLTKDAQTMANMPILWKACFAGQGDIDLSTVSILSKNQYLWAPTKFTSALTGLLASTTLSSKVEKLTKENYPKAFQSADFKGQVFALDEFVVDVPGVVRELVKANQEAVFKIEPLCEEGLKLDEHGNVISATVYMSGKSLEIKAQQFVFTAGAGNEVLINKFKAADISIDIAMQRRPLHMVLVKTPFDLPLYAHCLGLGARPRLTITSHRLHDGSAVWYLGGLLAEEGIDRDASAQIKAAEHELKTLFPWLDFTKASWATFMIDRAEPLQKSGLKPESSYVKRIGNAIIAWPTKLALAPRLAEEVLAELMAQQLVHQLSDIQELRAWPMPPIAKPVWEEMFCKNGG